MKPLGMTADFRIIRPTSVEDAIHRAVEEAIEANVTVKEFIRSAWESWEIVQKDKKNEADSDFRLALK